MSSLQVPSGPREGKSDTDGDNKESVRCSFNSIDLFMVQSYDPKCCLSQDLFEANRRVPEVLCKIQTESEKVRHHFRDDPRALKIWDEYIDDIHCASSRNLTYLLSSYAQRSGLYEQLMKKPCNNTSVSMSSSFGMLSDISDKLKQATSGKRVPVGVVLVAGVAAAFAAGLGIERPSLRKQHQSKET
ncbi:hypothetical protein EJB05_10459 [Eragrostis curvula]|uniref:Uncharacterized protein n=1 Tax=Eragrostis curvula TaxID=38414 RepID=A0A5J9VLP4_9POAL|nr:hypothetical protein EJB05_10459 [Eragrostis curvula]